MTKVRVRFAPSPTGPLHIGGVRTALYNYLFAKRNGGSFILRVEDTDQARYVEGAEKYIKDALKWSGLTLNEGPDEGGEYGPYRQSERKDLYAKYTNTLIEKGWAYRSFDSPDDLDKKREAAKADGNHSWQYDAKSRGEMKNSLTLNEDEENALIDQGVPFAVRFKIPANQVVEFNDAIRGRVSFQTNVLDDKVLFKADGMPTYHMANVIDDHHMAISHVIRGEEWLPSTPLHVLLYKAFDWEAPIFAHLPLILKPEGQGKLSKRDGAKFGFPVFPLKWVDPDSNEEWAGYKETGFYPEGFNNMLAFLGWNPGTEQEIFSLVELMESFSLEKVSKSGARFDYEKAKWFNQQHLIQKDDEAIAIDAKPFFDKAGINADAETIFQVCVLYKERVQFLHEIPEKAAYIFGPVKDWDEKMIRKKWKPENREAIKTLNTTLLEIPEFNSKTIEASVKQFMEATGLGFGQVLPVLRLAICGTMKGPSIFDVMEMVGKQTVNERLTAAINNWN